MLLQLKTAEASLQSAVSGARQGDGFRAVSWSSCFTFNHAKYDFFLKPPKMTEKYEVKCNRHRGMRRRRDHA